MRGGVAHRLGVTQRSAPAGFDFIATYASARLVATGHPGAVTDRGAIFAVEHATLPERTVFTFSVAALAASAFLIAPPCDDRPAAAPLPVRTARAAVDDRPREADVAVAPLWLLALTLMRR